MPEEKLGAAEGEMRILPDKEAPNFQSMLNTYILCLGIVGGFISVGVLYQTQVSTDKETQSWIQRHEVQHRERQAAIESKFAGYDIRITALESDKARLENLVYRVTVSEQSILATSKAVQDLQSSINNLSTDLRVVNTILTRVAEQLDTVPVRQPRR